METREGENEGTLSEAGQTMRDMGEQVLMTAAEVAERAKETSQRLAEQTIASARATDRAIRENPYQSLGVVFGIGVLIGLMLNRR